MCDCEGAELVQRSDDTEPVFKERMKTFEEQTAPVISHYRALGRFEEADGDQDVEAVSAAIDAVAVQFAPAGYPGGSRLTMAILIKTTAEIDKMRRSGEALRQVHEAVRPLVVAGASTMDLENAAAAKMDALRAVSAFKGYQGFPAVLCTSINSEVVHGIPSAEADSRRWRHGLRRLRGDRRRLLLRLRPSPMRLGTPIAGHAQAAGGNQGVAGEGHPAGPGGRPAGRHIRRRAGDVRGGGFRRGEGVCRPRDWPVHARGPPGAQLRHRAARGRG